MCVWAVLSVACACELHRTPLILIVTVIVTVTVTVIVICICVVLCCVVMCCEFCSPQIVERNRNGLKFRVLSVVLPGPEPNQPETELITRIVERVLIAIGVLNGSISELNARRELMNSCVSHLTGAGAGAGGGGSSFPYLLLPTEILRLHSMFGTPDFPLYVTAHTSIACHTQPQSTPVAPGLFLTVCVFAFQSG